MTATDEAEAEEATTRRAPLPGEMASGRLWRRSDDQIIAGVASGLADRLGVDPSYVRAAFVVASFAGGVGFVAYLAAWAVSAKNVRPAPSGRRIPARRAVGLAIMFLGGLVVLRATGLWLGDQVVWPVALVAAGGAVAWDRSGKASRWLAWAFPGLDEDARPSTLKIVAGSLLTFFGVLLFASGFAAFEAVGTVLLAVLVTGVGLSLVVGPWIYRLVTDLRAERADRIRSQERALVAAHLHDSVLQTLALIQRSDDPRKMITLARGQERELRAWLFDGGSLVRDGDGTGIVGAGRGLGAAVEAMAGRVEAAYDVPIDVVAVGDAPLTEALEALVAAAGEATANAAKHSGASRVSVFVEATPTRVEISVTDQGKGFDLDTIDDDRYGIRDSIIRRTERHGGTVTIVSEPGDGTEVRLEVERT